MLSGGNEEIYIIPKERANRIAFVTKIKKIPNLQKPKFTPEPQPGRGVTLIKIVPKRRKQ
jgi:hypothetical protein